MFAQGFSGTGATRHLVHSIVYTVAGLLLQVMSCESSTEIPLKFH
jgi:hypothetical protein